MDINRENMTRFFEELSVTFSAAFMAEADGSPVKQLAMELPSTGAALTHGWLNQLPSMREWLGDRIVQNAESTPLTVANRKFESTLEMPRVDLEDDQEGLYSPLVAAMGAAAAAHPEALCVEALLKGTATKWADGHNFFVASARKYGAATINNYSTDELSVASFNAAYTKMTSYVGHGGRPIGVRPMFLLHGPQLRTRAFEICRDDFAARTADATSGTAANQASTQGLNPNKGTVIPIQTPHLIDGMIIDGATYNAGKYWYLLGSVAGLRGLVWQNRLGAELQAQKWNPNSEFTFNTDKFQLGVRMRGAPFLAIPHLIVGNFAT